MSPLFEHYLHIIQERSISRNLITKALVVALDDDNIDFNQFMFFLKKLDELKIDKDIKYLKVLKTHDVKISTINKTASDLIPTQSEIDIDSSIGYPIKYLPNEIFDILEANEPLKVKNIPIITCGNGKYIIDGHHRWSQVLLINPRAEMVCVDIHLDSPLKTLKAIQLGIRATKTKLPSANVEGENLITRSHEQIKQWVEKKASEKIKRKFKKYSKKKWGAETDLSQLVADNAKILKDLSKKNILANQEIPRSIMPQTDGVDWASHIPYPDFDDDMREDFETNSVMQLIKSNKKIKI
jgi:hypothetical protein